MAKKLIELSYGVAILKTGTYFPKYPEARKSLRALESSKEVAVGKEDFEKVAQVERKISALLNSRIASEEGVDSLEFIFRKTDNVHKLTGDDFAAIMDALEEAKKNHVQQHESFSDLHYS